MSSARSITTFALILAVIAPAPVHAQAWRADGDDPGAMLLQGTLAAGAVFAFRLDGHLTNHARNTNSILGPRSSFTRVGDVLGRRGPLMLTSAILIGGWVGHDERVTALGTRGLRALTISYLATKVVKGFVGRGRPYGGFTPNTFRPGRGFRHHEFTSFPSGHASAAFGLATVFATGLEGPSLRTRRVIGGLSYLAAMSVATSRVALQQHWTSDVIAGAAVGFAAGSWVTRNVRPARATPHIAPAPTFSVRLFRATF